MARGTIVVIPRFDPRIFHELAPKGFSDVERRRLARQAEQDGSMADAIVTTLLNTGLRVDELVTLTMQGVHLQPRSGWIDVVGKGDKGSRNI